MTNVGRGEQDRPGYFSRKGIAVRWGDYQAGTCTSELLAVRESTQIQ